MTALQTGGLRMLPLSVLVTLFAATSVTGQQSSATSEVLSEYELLKKDVGTWETEINIWAGPHDKPIVSKGLETSKLLPGVLWLETRFEGKMGNSPCVGVGTWGYDPVEEKYVGTWVDSLTPHITMISGEYDPATKTMTHTSEGRDPSAGAEYKRQSTLRYKEDGSRLVEAFTTDQHGNRWKMLEVIYRLKLH